MEHKIDTSRPHSGRIYDYMLGGSTNFEADRKAAAQLLQLMPSIRNGMRLNRWFMHEVVHTLVDHEFTCYLDLASGLPTQGYVHELVPAAKVLYNDIDPVTVAHGREIIGENPNVRYIEQDIANIDAILASADELFGGERRVAISYIGITYFLTDATIERTFKALYDWCAPGSLMALSWAVGEADNPRIQQMMALYRQMGTVPTLRSPERIGELLADWEVQAPGLRPLVDWLDIESWGESGTDDEDLVDLYGVVVAKP